jgi:hypothetical protein
MNAACLAPPGILLGLLAPGRLDEACRALQLSKDDLAGVTFWAYLLVFLVNCVLETPAYGIAGRMLGRPARTVLAQILLLNLATHPAVYFAWPALAGKLGWTLLTLYGISELFAFAVEAALLRAVWAYSWRSAALASALANLSSWWAGAYLSFFDFLP